MEHAVAAQAMVMTAVFLASPQLISVVSQGGGSSGFTPLMDRIAIEAALAGSDAGFDGRKLEVRSDGADAIIIRRTDRQRELHALSIAWCRHPIQRRAAMAGCNQKSWPENCNAGADPDPETMLYNNHILAGAP